ncbi:hypothetical protein [Flagellimonas onchidii]|uniref:hypothetical protein n=1 Tax=Flagellimonas onchidii TaxID=2562684 RepID=UPI0010A635CD|nr:hypothetical protein [Allomuricauda onchidii]
MKKILALITTLCLAVGCSNNDDNETPTDCDFRTLVSSEQFDNAPSDELEIMDLDINGDCLKITFASGGCDGDSWELKLIASQAVTLPNTPRRRIRLSLRNEELCEAYITKESTFDISNLQVGGNQVRLIIANSDESILYQY